MAYHRAVVLRNELGNSTSKHLRGRYPTLVVPLGSTEQHGPHLPLDTDTRIATAVASAVTDELNGVDADYCRYLLSPAISYGAAGEHEGFPGTISIGTDALASMLVEYGRSACGWAHRVVFVNGHGGNVEALRSAVIQLRSEHRDVAWCACSSADGDAHAGHTETSVLLYISPSDVRSADWCRGNEEPLSRLLPRMRHGGVAAVSEVGVLGDPTTATREEGVRIFVDMAADCVQRVRRWEPRDDGFLT